MGHSSNKKKRGGGGRRSKARTPSKDHASQFGQDDDNEQLSEEITALCAIFQEDCKIVPGSLPQLAIKLRPYSKDMGYEDVDVSAILVVRCLPGYPFKCPKLQITPEMGLSDTDANKLLSLLLDQANLNAREGRVMIFNLVEAAQEFLSGIEPIAKPTESKFLHTTTEGIEELCPKDIIASSNKNRSFVYGFIDLFSGYGESWNWGFGIDETAGKSSSLPSSKLDASKPRFEAREKKSDSKENPYILQELPAKLDTVGEVSEDSNNILSLTHSSRSLVEDFVGNDSEGEKEYFIVDEYATEDNKGVYDSESSESISSVSLPHHQASQTIEKDLIMVHMLRLVCASKGTLTDSLPQLAAELYNLGIFSDLARDMASKPPSLFNKTFHRIFKKHLASSKISQFWTPSSDFGGSNTVPHSSRYLNDFEELRPLGHGGFGHVVLCKNKLDGRQYAMKKIRLKDKSMPDRILREVATLSRLQHQHVVRYYQAWFETGVADSYGDPASGSRTTMSSTFSYQAASSNDAIGRENQLESTYLYIQMEYCPRTLRQMFESYNHFDEELAWHLFRQIVEGLAHIHGQGIIHRDLTPSNIFFDARNDIKIGDFGLAKFLKLEQLDQDLAHPTDTTGVSIDGTGQVGTYFYTAPEIEQGWPKIDEKADMYSLGVVFFELWHPFGTAMERHVVLSDLKQKAELPPAWVAEFPQQEYLLRHLMSPGPSDRPSATELLQNAFPPRMESELLDDILRTMQKSEDTSIYDKVLNAIFDEEMLSTKHIRQVGRMESVGDNSSSIQHTDFVTEVRDYVVDVNKEIFRHHCAKHLEISPMRLMDDCPQFNRNAVKLLTHGGDMLELCHELRLPFVNWIISNQKSSFKRYEISYVYRRAVGHSSPNRHLQGDFDIIGGTSALTEAEVIKVTRDIVTCFFNDDSCDIHLNHAGLLGAIWSWTGIKVEHRLKVAELLSMMGSLRPQSSERKSKWVVIRRQLLQELDLVEVMVNRLQTVGLRFCGSADQALPRLRGALPSDKRTLKALDELSELVSLLRIWRIDKNVYIDALMPPTESYHRDLFFQVYLRKENSSGSLSEGVLLAVGGRYDYLLHQLWSSDYKGNSPTGVGTSLALETIIQNCPVDFKPNRNEANINILVCSRGGGGLLVERMELVAELWQENFKAWEAIDKNKSSNEVAPLEIESNRFGFSGELPGRLSPFRRSRAAAAGISPCRSKPQSPFQGVKLLGDAKETEINKSGNLKFYSTGLGKVQGVPNQGAKRSSYSGSLAIEKTLYIDTSSTVKLPSTNLNSVDNNKRRMDTMISELDKRRGKESNYSIEISQALDSEEKVTLDYEVLTSLGGNSSTLSGMLNHIAKEYEDEVLTTNQDVNRECASLEPDQGTITEDSETNNNKQIVLVNGSGKGGVESALSHLTPPLPKSPSESWLWRALPINSLKNSLLHSNHAKRNDSNTASSKVKWETIVKTSNLHHDHVRYSQELPRHKYQHSKS